MFLKVKIIVRGLRGLFLFKMAFLNKQRSEVYIYAFSEEKYSYSVIQKRCESHAFVISKASIGNIVKKKGKKTSNWSLKWNKSSKQVSKVKTDIFSYCKNTLFNVKRKSPSQRTVEKSLKC